jgi:tetratricopeptide (TPR) repeat protein
MSVIFRSLQKLKAQVDEDIRPALPYKKQRQIFPLHNGRFGNLRVVALVLLMFLGGIGTSYGIYKIRSDTKNVLDADDATAKPATAIDPPPEPSVAFLPEKDLKHPRRDTQYLPAPQKGDERRDGAAKRAAAKLILIPPVSTSGRSGVGRAADKEIAITAAAAHPQVAVKRRPAVVAKIVNEPHGQPPDRMKKTPLKITQQNVNRSLEINRLVKKIRFCMVTSDCEQIDHLFDQLQALKGAHNPYVLKLKGYWYLQQDQFESAVGLLQKVLVQDENDLEAGVNMAIAEMRLNRWQRAKRRLVRLREVYPDNAKLAEVWKQLKRLRVGS